MRRPALLVVNPAVFVDRLGSGIILPLLAASVAGCAAFDVWVALAYLAGAVLCFLAAVTAVHRFRGTAKDPTELMGQVA